MNTKSSHLPPQYIKRPVTNMHVKPDPMSEVDSQAIYGTAVIPLEHHDNWVKVETPDAYAGWVEEASLTSRSSAYPSTPIYAHVKNLFAHVYWVDDTSPHPPMLTLPFESPVEVITDTSQLKQRWIQVRLVDGTLGWIQRGDLTFNPQLLTLEEILALSTKFLGLPYTWGGTSSYGFDCSGYVQMLYRQMGLILPRNSSMQAEIPGAKAVEVGKWLPGDLLFFGPEGKRVTHVGLYLEEQRFIHTKARITDGAPLVQISRMDEPQWDEEYMCGRRVAHLISLS